MVIDSLLNTIRLLLKMKGDDFVGIVITDKERTYKRKISFYKRGGMYFSDDRNWSPVNGWSNIVTTTAFSNETNMVINMFETLLHFREIGYHASMTSEYEKFLKVESS